MTTASTESPAASKDPKRDRQLIVRAAISCFQEQGLPETSMQDIVQKSGLSSDVVFRHFPRKNDIVRLLGDMNTTTATGALHAILEETPLPSVDEFVGRLAVFFEKSVEEGDPVGVTPQGWGVALYDEEVNAIMREVVVALRDGWIDVSARMVDAGHLPDDADPEDVGRTLFSLFLGFILQSLLGDIKADHVRRALHAILR